MDDSDASIRLIPEDHPLIVISDEESPGKIKKDESTSMAVVGMEKIKSRSTPSRWDINEESVKIKKENPGIKGKNSTIKKESSRDAGKPTESFNVKTSASTAEKSPVKLNVKSEALQSNTAAIKQKVNCERKRKCKQNDQMVADCKKPKIEKDESSSTVVVGTEKIKSRSFRSHWDIKEENVKIKNKNPGTEENTSKIKKESSRDAGRPIKNSNAEENVPPKLGSGILWEAGALAREASVPVSIAQNIVSMLRNDCTIPFMARYRREMTGNMDADNLRRIKDCYQHIKTLERKALTAMKQVNAAGKLTPKLQEMIYSVKSLDELDFIYAPYKKGSSKSKAEKARALGMEQAAIDVLEGRQPVDLASYIDCTKTGLQSEDEVIEAIQHIVADLFAKDEEMLNYLSEIEKHIQVTIRSSRVKSSQVKAESQKTAKKNIEDAEKKFESYYDFTISANRIQSHQILALNRAESMKILSVKYTIDVWLERKLYDFLERKWIKGNFRNNLRKKIFETSFHDSYSRLISPFVIRRIKSTLNRKAQYEAIESFAQNLKNLLQTPPVKGCPILGIDPGYRHGSKFALISRNGDVLWTEIFTFGTGHSVGNDEKYMKAIRQQLIHHNCELVAIGNGTGCRNIEKIFSGYIEREFFRPELNLQYTIVNERGASIYSCSKVAKEEFPNLDPNLISAVFIARALQDPLSEFVKVEPKHLGVGMYQLDMPEKQLSDALDDVVEQCVSFVGVDLNTASIHLLTRVSGLGPVRAKSIIEWRQQNTSFKNRQQLLKVKGIGSKIFEQCAGFVRIYPCTNESLKETKKEPSSKLKNIPEDYNPFDGTCIHPESYLLAEKFVKKCGLDTKDVGTQAFIDRVREIVRKGGAEKIATELVESQSSISLITDALTQPLDYDYRNQFSKPVFRQGLEDINNLVVGMEMNGVVGNVATFGAFVDIGVGRDGLIHVSAMGGHKIEVGNRVKVRILDVQPERNRIQLHLLGKC